MGQKEFIEVDGAASLSALCEENEANRIFLVTRKASFESSGARVLLERALGGRSVCRFSDFGQGPNFDDVVKGARYLLREKSEIIVAIGGGTVIDMAKSINVFQAHDNQHELLDLAMGKVPVTQTGLPLVAVPTTAGTGSEATHFAVIYVGDTKYSLAHSTMLPKYAIVDSRLTHGQPAYLTACTGFDALCQAVESYWANGATDESQQYAHRAMTIIFDNLKGAVHGPSASVRASMATAANLAGKAINISKTTGPHALSYGLTRNYGVPHGHAVALMMLRFLKLHADIPKNPGWVQHPKGVNYVNETMNQLFACMSVDESKAAATCWENLMDDCGLTMKLQELGVKTSDDVDALIENINFQRLSNHPIALSQKMARSFF